AAARADRKRNRKTAHDAARPDPWSAASVASRRTASCRRETSQCRRRSGRRLRARSPALLRITGPQRPRWFSRGETFLSTTCLYVRPALGEGVAEAASSFLRKTT